MSRFFYPLVIFLPLLIFCVLPAVVVAQSPGGISTGLSLWLKGDAGVSLTGGAVSAWADQSGNGNNATQGTAANRPEYITGELNENPVLDFISNDRLDGSAGFYTHEYFMVLKPEYNASSSATVGNLIGFESGFQSGYSSFSLGPITGRFNNEVVSHLIGNSTNYGVAQIGTDVVYNEPVIFNSHNNAAGNGQLIKANGTDIVTNTFTGSGFNNRSNTNFRIGDDFSATGPFDGKIAEVISYSARLSDAARRDVSTYLAIKYGITLSITPLLGYTAGGTDIFSFTDYSYDIAGIGRSDNSTLNQTSSKSVNNGNIVTVQSPSDLGDGEYLIWGNDGAVPSFVTTNVPEGAYERLSRVWRTAETGEVGTVSIVFDVTTLGININNSTVNLFIVPSAGSVPSDFASATVVTGGILSSDANGRSIVTFNDVNFDNGDYFTIGGDIQTNSPGGTDAPPSLWLRADEGVIHSSNAVSKWTDYGGGGNDVLQGNLPERPTLVSKAINFNDALDFSGDYMDGARGFYTQDYFVVMKPNVTITNATTNAGFLLGFQPNEFSGLGLGSESNRLANERIFHAAGSQGSGYHQGTNAGTFSGVIIVNSRNNAGSNGQELYADGVLQTSVSAGTYANLSNQPFRVGNNFTDSESFNGQIAEIISFSSRLSDTERRDVESYLALKYGVSLSIASTGYTDNGEVIYGYTPYPNSIAGVGQNLNNSFKQLRSAGGIVTMEYPTDLQDEEYIIWGRDGGSESATKSDEMPSGFEERLTGEWRVAVTGSPGNVTVKMYVAGVDAYSERLKQASLYHLLVGTSSNFNSVNSSYQGVSFSGDTVVFNNVAFADGDYFTLAIPAALSLPGSGATVWLRADAGVTLNGGNVQTWTNQLSATLTNVTQGTAARRPAFNTNALNGNPVISFDGSDDILASATINQPNIFSNTAGSIFSVMRRNSAGHYISWRRDDNRRLILRDNGGTGYTYNYATLTVNAANDYDGDYVLVKGLFTGSGATSISINGTQAASGTAPASLGMNSQAFNIGARAVGNSNANMEIAEVITYNTALSATDQQTVETYLAIKYGLTKSLPYAINGTEIYNLPTLANDIAGIGAFSTMGLYQAASSSVNSGAILSMSNPSSLGSGDYLVWGHDDGSVLEADMVALAGAVPGMVDRIARVWGVQQTNSPGDVTVSLNLTGLGYSGYAAKDFRLIPVDGSFQIIGLNTPVSFNSETLVFDNVDFSGAIFFVIGVGMDLAADADGDGIPDYFEVAHGTLYNDGDNPVAGGSPATDVNTATGPDGDGISDALELILISNGATSPVTRQTDTDGDGIPDYIEVANGTDPFNSNSPFAGGSFDGDEDGLPDLTELHIALLNIGVDPWTIDWSVDSDGDGIPDGIETLAGWNPGNAGSPVANGNTDTDGDGALDGVEWVLAYIDANFGVMNIGTDTDNDGVPDYFEYLNGSAPNDANSPVNPGASGGNPIDTDGDGVSDALEAALIAFGVPGPITPTSDNDGDGIPDFIEALTYSDPLNMSSPSIPSPLNVRALQADYQATATSCVDISGYQWIHVTDNLGNLIFSVNPVGHDLGSTCYGVRILSGWGNVRTNTVHYILNRNWWIEPAMQPNLASVPNNVYIRFYVLNQENQDLQSKIGDDGFTINPSDLSGFVADSIKFTKISGIGQNLNPWIEGGQRILIEPVAIEYNASTTIYTLGVSSFSDFVPHNAPNNPEQVLPVEWLYVRGEAVDGKVLLQWATASEQNNDYFEIQRSFDGTHFSIVGAHPGKGTTSQVSTYNFTDVAAPSGILYYRIRQVDYDGKFDYSKTVRVENSRLHEGLEVTIFPNPSQGSITLRLVSSDAITPPSISIHDLAGKLLYSSEMPAEAINADYALELRGKIAPGIYIVTVRQFASKKNFRLIIE